MSKYLGILINKISNQLKRKMDKEMNDNYNLTKTQSLVLSYINSNKDIYQKDIEKRFSIRRSTATEILNLMEKRNLIKRIPSKLDKRINIIEITEEGKKLEKVGKEKIKELEKQMTKSLTREEKKELIKLLEKVEQNLLEREKTYDKKINEIN